MVPGFKQDVNFTLQDEGVRERSLFKSSESDRFILDACETVSDAVVVRIDLSSMNLLQVAGKSKTRLSMIEIGGRVHWKGLYQIPQERV